MACGPWWASQVTQLSGKESAYQCRSHRRCGFISWVGKIPWRSKWQPIPVFLPGKFYGQRSLAGYSPWGLKSQTLTEWLSTHAWCPPWITKTLLSLGKLEGLSFRNWGQSPVKFTCCTLSIQKNSHHKTFTLLGYSKSLEYWKDSSNEHIGIK